MYPKATQDFLTPLFLAFVLVFLCGCQKPGESKPIKRQDDVEEPRQLSLEEKKKKWLDTQPYDDTQKLVFDAIEKSTAESIKRPKLVYANFDRSYSADRRFLEAEWIGNSACRVDEICVRLSNGEVFTFDCSKGVEHNEDYLHFGFEWPAPELAKKLDAQKMPGAVVFLKRNGVICSEKVPLWERLRTKEKNRKRNEERN